MCVLLMRKGSAWHPFHLPESTPSYPMHIRCCRTCIASLPTLDRIDVGSTQRDLRLQVHSQPEWLARFESRIQYFTPVWRLRKRSHQGTAQVSDKLFGLRWLASQGDLVNLPYQGQDVKHDDEGSCRRSRGEIDRPAPPPSEEASSRVDWLEAQLHNLRQDCQVPGRYLRVA